MSNLYDNNTRNTHQHVFKMREGPFHLSSSCYHALPYNEHYKVEIEICPFENGTEVFSP